MEQHETDEISPRAALSREKMIRAATDLLVHSGPRAVTVDAVAADSGVAKSTLYRHWSSRTELLIDVITCRAYEIERPDQSLGFEAALRFLLKSAAVMFADPEWIQIFPSVASLRTSIPELDAFFEADIAEKKQALSEVLDLGIAEGALPATIGVDEASSLLIGPIVFTALTRPSDNAALDDLVRLADYAVDRFIASHR